MDHLILIDGPRGSGKSTTAQTIVDVLNSQGRQATYFKKGLRSEENEYQNMMDHLARWRREHGIIVVDRFVATEWVMSTAHERVHARQLMQECIDVNMELLKMAAIHVILLPSLGALAGRLEERGPDGRLWDMEKQLIHPLWRSAYAFLTSASLIANNRPFDQQNLIGRLIGMVAPEIKYEALNRA